MMKIADVDLNLLVALEALLSERNVTKAGRRIGLSQPAMSSALRRLRGVFQDELLVLEGRQYTLTTLAAKLLPRVHETLGLTSSLLTTRLDFDPETDTRSFSLLATDHLAFVLLLPLLKRLRVQAPKVTLQVHQISPGADERQIDLILKPAHNVSEFQSQTLFCDRWVCAVWAGNERVGESLNEAQFLRSPRLGYTDWACGMLGLSAMAGSCCSAEDVCLCLDNQFLMLTLLRETRMVAMVQQSFGRRLPASSEIRLVEPLFDTPSTQQAMFWPRRYDADPAHLWLRQQFLAAARSMQDQDNHSFTEVKSCK